MAIHTFFLFLFVLPSLVGAVCNDPSNVCHLDDINYAPANGYDCFQIGNQQNFICTCYGNHITMNEPCRCRTAQVCGTESNVLGCLEISNTEYVCVCQNGDSYEYVKNKPCGNVTAVPTVISTTSTSTQASTRTTTANPDKVQFCINGIYDPEMQFCHCPSGFSGRYCDKFDLEHVCDRIVCKNGGTCTYGYRNATYYSKCVCPIGFQGEYCEDELILGTCQYAQSVKSCGTQPCRESVESDGQAYFKCGPCSLAIWGALCDHYSDIPRCRWESDRFVDPYMHEQGKYFECGEFIHGYPTFYRNSCPKGLRYSMAKNLCVLPEYA